MKILHWFLAGFVAVALCIGIWYIAEGAIKIDRAAQVQGQTKPYTGPERRSGEDRRKEYPPDEPTNTGVPNEVAPYVVATPRRDVTIYKMVHEGCEIYLAYTSAYSDNTSIALGRGCK
jgi:hypothetical protein